MKKKPTKKPREAREWSLVVVKRTNEAILSCSHDYDGCTSAMEVVRVREILPQVKKKKAS